MARTRRRNRAKPASARLARSQPSRRNKKIRNRNLIGKAAVAAFFVCLFLGFLLISEPTAVQVTVLPGTAAAFGTALGTAVSGAAVAVISAKRVRRNRS
ncbi:hypothetical protein [Streptomyces sp. H27-S2]|uniref:hypothetical protein n=1 Tax=Streptomyces antarcticus TaxID=2996458 RepID=UPI0022708B46|nr:hypothetical protein [Streptomyces sp. H27-S2]MCY0954118.1 hypothetical protein [Streptomyces sp. H27-S2]